MIGGGADSRHGPSTCGGASPALGPGVGGGASLVSLPSARRARLRARMSRYRQEPVVVQPVVGASHSRSSPAAHAAPAARARSPTAFGLVVNHPSFGPRGTRIKSAGGKECQQPLLVVFRGLVDAVAAVAAAAPRSMGWCGCVGWIDSRPTKRATPRRASPPSALDQWGSSYKGSIARPINLVH